jgi:hypothetical protein
MGCILFFPSSAPWIIFCTSFQSSLHITNLVLLKLYNDLVPTFTQVQKFPEVTKGGAHHFTYYTVSLIKVNDMPRVRVTHQQKKFLHLSDGEIGKHLRQI